MPVPVSWTSTLARSPTRPTDTPILPRRRVLEGVVKQIEEQPLEPSCIPRHRDGLMDDALEAKILGVGDRFELLCDAWHERTQVDRASAERDFAGLGTSQCEELIHQPCKFVDLLNLACRARPPIGVVSRVHQRQLDLSPQRGQRRAQFVGEC